MDETEIKKQRKKEYYKQWLKTEAGKLSRSKANKKYSQTVKGKASIRRKNRRANIHEYLKKWRSSPYQKERMRKYHLKYKNTEHGRKMLSKNQYLQKKRTHQLFPEKENARYKVFYAVKAGKIPRIKTLVCLHCPNPAQHYHHTNGYSPENALKVIPLCMSCHKEVHKI